MQHKASPSCTIVKMSQNFTTRQIDGCCCGCSCYLRTIYPLILILQSYDYYRCCYLYIYLIIQFHTSTSIAACAFTSASTSASTSTYSYIFGSVTAYADVAVFSYHILSIL
ncbi:hypothetical protein GQX74_000386 [Glossina fuscipes]|nr:hypothetical protein GQX74_000386 [Glossina fuscipes]